MKILLATFWVIPHVGGVWNYMVQLKESLEKMGHNVDLLGYGEDKAYIHLVNKKKKISVNALCPEKSRAYHHQNNTNERVAQTERHMKFYEAAAASLGLSDYDLIHTQDVLSTAAISHIKPKHVPLVATLHGSVALKTFYELEATHQSSSTSTAKEYFKNLEHFGATCADITIVANHWLKNVLIHEFDVPAEQIQVHHYGYNCTHFVKQLTTKTSLRTKKKVIIYTGRLVMLKGVDFLLSALGRLKQQRAENDWVCWIVGDGDMSEQLTAQAKKLGLINDVIFFGTRQDVPYLLSQADIHVSPSLLDNQPLSVIEAQLAGKAVIVSRSGGLPEMVDDGVTGIIVPERDPQALSEKLDFLLDNDRLREKLGTSASKWGSGHWSQECAVQNLVRIYEQVKRKEGQD
ncbi:glycosyltransferase family 4 protein [Sporolactobacillus nakayamae]|uniref:Glycosyltransferase involved in cell wall bisynthesis n=1 Tax=Sporolactobacillus nakayamae TaxID=269670 RepID=A0A1I2QR72_9BACL|nr:glycosyltransferase family 4 protein [Sporolactobacillus nakayamae]SFG28111.1 Glycosyltransferase involved in cell wall bisynthesis [Sporolactobacillus nakayamae]